MSRRKGSEVSLSRNDILLLSELLAIEVEHVLLVAHPGSRLSDFVFMCNVEEPLIQVDHLLIDEFRQKLTPGYQSIRRGLLTPLEEGDIFIVFLDNDGMAMTTQSMLRAGMEKRA